ncbi:PAS domain-containing sensor histidine kinase [Methylobrevis pamukkalensis]|uniref:Sensor protein FixL n=1 Tax=Methylobrevis pamukkalensis TaxID=1439726 RepID=A0A1E3H7Q0_9HYPH|nr:PAS domain S-box protein [Methylobrevis pamukkalensis]ODN72342.1 Sensor protein FixL [Methylobrevis pamukkalensis]
MRDRAVEGDDSGAGEPGPGSTVSGARFASVLDTAVDGIVVIDDRARILAFNKSCEKMFGYAAADVIGENVKIIMPPSFSVHHDGYLNHYLATGERRIIGIGREVTGQHRDGTEFPVELSVGEAETPEGRQFIGILRDLRSRKAVEQRLIELQAQVVHMARLSAMDEMGAAMAHELNQPLTALMLYLQAVTRQARQAGTAMSPTLVQILEKALREAERAAGIIERMRNFVERREPERQPVDLVAAVAEALDLIMVVAQGSTVPVHFVPPDAPVMVDVDPIQIQQIVVNLVRNAVEVARNMADKWVRVELEADEEQARVIVTDSGPGIPKDVARTMFRTFATTKKTGMGLGLAISRSIAQNHGGDLTVVPGGNGTGARFVLHLPRPDKKADGRDDKPPGAA